METQHGQNKVLAQGTALPFPPDPTPQEEWVTVRDLPQRIGYGERRIKRAMEALHITVEARLRQTITGKRTVNSVLAANLPAMKDWIEQDIARTEELARQGITADVEATPQTIDTAAPTVPSDTSIIASGAPESLIGELRGQLAAKDALVKQLQGEITFLRSAFLKGQDMVATALAGRTTSTP